VIRPKVSSVEVSRIELVRPEPDFERGLARPRVLHWAPVGLSTEDLLPTVRENAPTIDPGVVEWMQYCAADMAVLEGMASEYSRAGSALDVRSGDGYVPGVSLPRMYVVSQSGYVVGGQGYACIRSPTTEYRCPLGSKLLIVEPDFLGWAFCDRRSRWGVQFRAVLMNWRELASTPVDQRVRFYSTSGLTAPHFFMAVPPIGMTHVLKVGLTSDQPQTVALTMRDPNDYTREIGSLSLDLDRGGSVSRVRIAMVPNQSYVLHVQPEDGVPTVLDNLTVSRF